MADENVHSVCDRNDPAVLRTTGIPFSSEVCICIHHVQPRKCCMPDSDPGAVLFPDLADDKKLI